MYKPAGYLFIIFLIITPCFSQEADSTHIYGGLVYGTWPAEDSPFIIHESITIPSDSTLIIEPGVKVEFQGYYALYVQGRLLAEGTESDTILFTVNDTTGFSNTDTGLGGWNGIRFANTPVHNDTSKIIFCKLQYGKAISDVWFLNCGGALCIIEFDKIIVSHSLFTHNLAGDPVAESSAGGAVHLAWSDVTFIENTFTHNTADAGGAIHFHESDPIFIGNTFKYNSAFSGGAIAMGSICRPTLTGDIFLNNKAEFNGGGIMFWEPSEVFCDQLLLQGNSAEWGGAIGVAGGKLKAKDCIISGNRVMVWGGGIAGDYADLEITGCTFENDTSIWGSGALHADHSDVIVRDCEFTGNLAIYGAGHHAVYSSVFIYDCLFRDNVAQTSSAIHTEFTDLTVKRCGFYGNTAINSVGGIYNTFGKVAIDSCTFLKNTAGWAGGIQMFNSDLSIDSCLFRENEAVSDYSGALDVYADSTAFGRPYELEIKQSRFIRNTAATRCAGARIEQPADSPSRIDVTVDGCEFLENHSDVYAPFRISGGMTGFKVMNSQFCGNTTTRWAAGPGFTAGSSGTVGNCVFACNYATYSDSTATMNGAAVANGVQVTFHNCTFSDTSEAGGYGLSVHRGSNVQLINSIIWSCGTNPVMLASGVGQGPAVRIDYCTIENGQDSIPVPDSTSTLYWGDGNLDTNPLFVDPSNLDFHLQNISPCIGAGINCLKLDDEWFCSPPFDIEGTERPWPEGSECDMGAYEHTLGDPSAVEDHTVELPVRFALYQNYPNPFNSKTVISYKLQVTSNIDLSIYNILGQKVATLFSGDQPPGSNRVEWDASNFPSGVYIYRLSTGKKFVQSKKCILLR